MADIYLDSWMLAFPEADADPEAADGFVATLLGVHSLTVKCALRAAVSARTPDLLAADHRFPLSDPMPRHIWPQRGDVMRLVGAIVDRLAKIEDDDAVDAVLVNHASWDPGIVAAGASPRANEHLADLFARSAIHSQRRTTGDGPLLMTRMDVAGPRAVRFTGTIADIEFAPGGTRACDNCHAVEVWLASGPGEAVSALKPATLWRLERYDDAIDVAVSQGETSQEVRWPMKGHAWTFGTDFIDSTRALSVETTSARLDAMIRALRETVLGEQMAAVHKLRIDRGGNSRQLTRKSDGAGAFRRDVDRELHLHYWQTDGGPEFANLVTHNDFTITD